MKFKEIAPVRLHESVIEQIMNLIKNDKLKPGVSVSFSGVARRKKYCILIILLLLAIRQVTRERL